MQSNESAVAQGAEEVGDMLQNSMVNALDGAENAVDAATGAGEVVNAVLAAPQFPGWGSDVDAFGNGEIALDPINDADHLRASGEMGCSFVPSGREASVMVAKADVKPAARAIAVVSNGGIRARLVSAAAGGFGALAQGTRLVGNGVAADIKLTSRVSLTPVGQQSSYPASLTVTTDEGRRHVFAGRWICGLQK